MPTGSPPSTFSEQLAAFKHLRAVNADMHGDRTTIATMQERLLGLHRRLMDDPTGFVASEIGTCRICGQETVVYDRLLGCYVHLDQCRIDAYTSVRDFMVQGEC